MAGASKVYAVEATDMAKKAREIIDHNGYGNIVEVVQGTIETVKIPEKVDIIISEWMGYFLLRESMLDSVLVARDRFLKPDGAMYPSHARMYMCPIRTSANPKRQQEYHNSLGGWDEFTNDMKQLYGVDLRCMDKDYDDEQEEYFLQTGLWQDVHPDQMLGPPTMFKEYDLKYTTLEELKAPLKASMNMMMDASGPVEGLCGFFDVTFAGSKEHPAYQKVELPTSPDATGSTHWGQQTFLCVPPIRAGSGDKINCDIEVVRARHNQRLMEVKMVTKVEGESEYAMGATTRKGVWRIE